MARSTTKQESTTPTQTNEFNSNYIGKLYLLSSGGSAVGIDLTSFTVKEERGNGWVGVVTLVVASDSNKVTVEDVFTYVMNNNLLPGTIVSLSINPDSEAETAETRIWPSIISRIETVPWSDNLSEERTLLSTNGAICKIHISDPLRYFSESPVWGVYKNRSLDEILGGMFSLACGGNGLPTATPIIEGLPTISITKTIREGIDSIPYTIAAGETLREWIGAVFGRLGVRIEICGRLSNNHQPQIEIHISDSIPIPNISISMEVSEYTSADGTAIAIRGVNLRPIREQRGAVVDNPSIGMMQRVGPPGPVETLFYGSNINVDEALYRNLFNYERDMGSSVAVSGDTTDPRICPGHVVLINDADADPMFGIYEWQVVNVHHTYNAQGYVNRVLLEDKDIVWRPPVPPEWGPVIISGVVSSETVQEGEIVSRDRIGRIPVSFSIASENTSDPLTLDLTIIEPMAGRQHGFIPQHRAGDLCRVSIVNPLYAEVIGFCYRTDRAIPKSISNASAGLVVRHGEGKWEGILFRPYKEIVEEKNENEEEGETVAS